MSDQTSDIKSSAAELHKAESSFGGFTERISYENSQSKKKSGKGATLLKFGCICLFFGVFMTMCGVLFYHVVQSNRSLYYPMEEAVAYEETHVSKKAALAEHAADFEKHLVDVSKEMADRYRVPEGVLVKSMDSISKLLSADIRVGDIIVSFGGDVINDAEKLFSMLTVVECCEAKQIVLFRDNEYITMKAVIGK